MAGELKIWALVAGLGYLALGYALKAWKSPRQVAYLSKAWILWGLACLSAALFSIHTLRYYPASQSAWKLQWLGFDWQLSLWTLSSLPFYIFLSLDFKAETGGYQRSALACALGAALGPIVVGAFPLSQLLSVLAPCLLLELLLRIVKLRRRESHRLLWTIAALNLLLAVHGLMLMPPLLGALALASILAWGLNPRGARDAGMALLFASIGLLLKDALRWNEPYSSLAIICMLIFCGWMSLPPFFGIHRVTST